MISIANFDTTADRKWIPAFAGMTMGVVLGIFNNLLNNPHTPPQNFPD